MSQIPSHNDRCKWRRDGTSSQVAESAMLLSLRAYRHAAYNWGYSVFIHANPPTGHVRQLAFTSLQLRFW